MTKRNKQTMAVDHLAESNAFLREVDETLRVDRMTELWLQYRMFFFIALGVVFCMFAGYEYYKQATEERLTTQAETYWALSQQEGTAQTQQLKELAQNGATGYRLLAQFQIARQLTSNGKLKEAANVYAQVAANEKNQAVYRDLAKFYQAQLLMDSDTEQAQSLFTKLVEGESAYMASSLEMLGNMAESKNDLETAKGYYERVQAMASAPAGLRSRTQSRLDVIARVMNQ